MASPSLLHQLLVELAEKQLEALLPTEIAAMAQTHAAAWTSNKGELGAVAPAELRADLVMRLGPHDAPAHVVIVEVQMRWEDEKRWRWPHYYVAACDRYRCGVSMLVVTPTRHVAQRCAPPAEFPPGFPWRPTVLGPDEALAMLQQAPPGAYTTEARMLLVLLAGRIGGEPMAHHALAVIRSLDTASVPHYPELIDRMLSAAGRTLLRSLTMKQLAKDNVWKHKNPLTRALLREGQQTELLRLVAPHCSEDELAALEALPDLDALRAAVLERLGPTHPPSVGSHAEHKNAPTPEPLRAGYEDGFREALVSMAASLCSEAELASLRALPDLDALRAAVYARLGLPAPGPAKKH